MRIYRKRAPEQRQCVHCAKPFTSAHKRRIYCGNSCSTLAYYARRRAQPAPVEGLTRAVPTSVSADVPTLAAPAPVVTPASLPADLQTIGVVAAGTMVGTVGMRLLDKVLDASPVPAAAPVASLPLATVPVDPASWFPAAILATPAASLLVHHPEWPQAQLCLQLSYFGRRFYYQPTRRQLFWECAPGQLWPLNLQSEFTRVFELPIPPLDRPLLDYAAAPRALPNAND
jgi:hypothetical protein